MRSNHRPCLWTVLPLLVLIVGVTHALVATTDQDECAGPDLDRAIAACTSLLQNGQVPPRVQVATLHHRGVAYVRNRDYDRALADYDTALQIAPHNPFVKTMTRSLSATRSFSVGLSTIEPEGAALVVFAAKHGQTAMDGTGGNSPFVAAWRMPRLT